MSYGFRGMPLTPEVNTLEGKVGGDQNFVTEWDAQDGSVIPDPERDARNATLARKLANPPNYRLFRGGHRCSHYTEAAGHWPNSSSVWLSGRSTQRLTTLELLILS